MAEIALSGHNPDNLVALVDDGDLQMARSIRWYAHRPKASNTIYAKNPTPSGTLYLHRIIAGAKEGEEVDHIDGNGLNCRRANLRIVSHADNLRHGRTRRVFERARDCFDVHEHLL